MKQILSCLLKGRFTKKYKIPEIITSFWMGVTAHGWVNQNPEMMPEDVGTFLGKIKVISSISGHSSTFQEFYIF